MAQYKVPQDVEADDKLIGPFNFRQFVYLLISGGLIAMAVGLFQIFPALAIIPVPFVAFFLALALPLKKDQPMETYLAAIISYNLKPRKRVWTPGQRESTILITAPKIVEEQRTRDITGEEATHRLSFLADIVDTGGYAIKGMGGSSVMRDDLVAEAAATPDMFDDYRSQVINRVIDQDKMARHQDAIREMREAIERNDIHNLNKETKSEGGIPAIVGTSGVLNREESEKTSQAPARPISPERSTQPIRPIQKVEQKEELEPVPKKEETKPPKADIIELANNPSLSVATIAKEANRLKGKDEGEVFISLH